jgi:4-hydroxy-3-methylbut-2-enyl diphosphate reductase
VTRRVRGDGGLLVLAPLRVEAAALRRGVGSTGRVVVTGMGPAASERAVRALDGAADGPVAVVGFCGSLRDGVEPGDVVVASEVRGPTGVVSLPSAAAVSHSLRRTGLKVHVGPILSTDHVVRGAERTERATDGALAVDMESFWLVSGVHARRAVADLHTADAAGIDRGARPGVEDTGDHITAVVRVVSDSPGSGFRPAGLPASGVKGLQSLARVGGCLENWAAATGARTVLIAAPRSFCAGVCRAIDIIEQMLAQFGPPLYVRREIVHNKHVVDSFRDRGVVFVRELSEVPQGRVVVLAAHGVSPAVRAEAQARGMEAIDATCPLVARLHAKARMLADQGHFIVFIGKKGHDETEGVVGEAPNSIVVVEDQADIDRLVDGDSRPFGARSLADTPIATLTQTTLVPHEVEGLVAGLRGRFPHLIAPQTTDVCYASRDRQAAVRRVAPECDLFLVIGSANSSNSKRLLEEAEHMGTPAALMDDESDLDLARLVGVRTLGLTAGASAPEALVERMLAFLESLGPLDVRELRTGADEPHFSPAV